jgi:hypothetical protein
MSALTVTTNRWHIYPTYWGWRASLYSDGEHVAEVRARTRLRLWWRMVRATS